MIDPQVVDALVARRTRTASSPLATLTARELDVLREMAQGKTNAGVEQALNLSASTVEKHVKSIFGKLGLADGPVHRRVAAGAGVPARATRRRRTPPGREGSVRLLALAAAVVLTGLVVSGCEKRAGLLAEQRSAAAQPRVSTSAPPPPPTWQLAEAAETKPSSVLWDVTAVDARHAWAVGHDTYDPQRSDTTGVPIIQEWDGTTWSRAELPGVTWHGGIAHVAADAPDNVWAVGGHAGSDPNQTEAHLLRYDGATWAEVPFPPGKGTTITDLAVSGGHTWLIGHRGSDVVVQQWDGSAWKQHQPPSECTQRGTSFGGMPTFCNFTGIVAFGPDDVWVAGNAAWPGFKGPLLFHWDGKAWRPVKVGVENADTAFSEISGTPGDLWAVGHTSGYGGPVAVHGDGTKWRMIEGLPTARMTDIAVDERGNPWVLENFPAPSAALATYRDGRWTNTEAPLPPDTTGISLNGITTIPGTPNMFAVGDVDLPGEPKMLQSVLLAYRG